MAKHTSKEAYFERLKNLSGANKPSIKESKTRNIGSLIDYKRAADGIAYGIVKENHQYYLKKAGTKQDPNVADFTYIGGMENITGYQYKSLAEADKQRNMIFHTINEAVGLKPDKNGGNKKRRLHEGDASAEIDQAMSKLGDLEAATSASEVPAEPAAPEGGAEMAAGLEAKPEGSEEMPAPDMGGAPEGGEEVPAPDMSGEEGAPEGGEELPSPDAGAEGEEGAPEGGEGEVSADDLAEPVKEIEKGLGKITEKIRKTDLEDSQVKSFINSFVSAFKDKLRDIDIEDRKEMANNILKVVDQEEIEDLGDSIPQGEPEGGAPEGGIEEEQCAECGGFGKYAESRGYGSPESFMECDDEEKANVVGGYASAHNDGMNDGDFKTVAIVITPEILQKLKGDYGHDEYAEKLTPYTQEMNESSDEDKMAELNELWSGLKSAGQAIGKGIGGAVKSAGQAIGTAATDLYKAGEKKVTNAVGDVKKAYYSGEAESAQKKVNDIIANAANQIKTLVSTQGKAGMGSNLATTAEEASAKLKELLGVAAPVAAPVKPVKSKKVAETVNGVDPGNTQVGVPNMLKEEDEEEIENDEVDVDVDNLDVDDNEEKPFEKSGDKPLEFAPGAQTLGVTTVKPDGAGVEIKVEPDKTVTLSMNEAKRKLIKQIAEGVNDYLGEVSTGYANKASGAAYDKYWNAYQDNNNQQKNKFHAQGGKFAEYLNPEIRNLAKQYGFNATKSPGGTVILAAQSKDGNVIEFEVGSNDYRPLRIYAGKTVDDLNDTSKSKFSLLVNKIQQDLKGGQQPAQPAGEQQPQAQPAMNESERKIRKYVRARLEEMAGMRKPTLNESKKSPTLKKLDAVIEKQFKLYESAIKKKK